MAKWTDQPSIAPFVKLLDGRLKMSSGMGLRERWRKEQGSRTADAWGVQKNQRKRAKGAGGRLGAPAPKRGKSPPHKIRQRAFFVNGPAPERISAWTPSGAMGAQLQFFHEGRAVLENK